MLVVTRLPLSFRFPNSYRPPSMPLQQVCDWPEHAGCTGGTPTDIPTPTEEPDPEKECDCECCLEPDAKDCTKYYICKVC